MLFVADSVGVILVGRQPFRLKKNLVAFFVGKAVDFVFDTGAVPWAYSLNLAGEHGASVKARPNNRMGAFVGVRDPARHLLGVHGGTTISVRHETKDGHGCDAAICLTHAITRLLLAF